MSYINKKTVFQINKQTRMNDDYSEKENNIRNNRQMREYQLFPNGSGNRKNYINSMNNVGVYHNKNGDGRGHFIDEESSFRNGKFENISTNDGDKVSKQLSTRQFKGVPFMGSGQSTLKNPDLKSKLIYGEQTTTGKSCNSLAGASVNRFTPLIPCIKDNVQKISHIVPEYWVRGGMNTRTIIRNIDYMKSRGLRK